MKYLSIENLTENEIVELYNEIVDKNSIYGAYTCSGKWAANDCTCNRNGVRQACYRCVFTNYVYIECFGKSYNYPPSYCDNECRSGGFGYN